MVQCHISRQQRAERQLSFYEKKEEKVGQPSTFDFQLPTDTGDIFVLSSYFKDALKTEVSVTTFNIKFLTNDVTIIPMILMS